MPLASTKSALKSEIKAIFDNIGDPGNNVPCPSSADKAALMAEAVDTFLKSGIPMTTDLGNVSAPATISGFNIVAAVPLALSGIGGIDTVSGAGMGSVKSSEASSFGSALSNQGASSDSAADAFVDILFNIYSAAMVTTETNTTWPSTVPLPVPPPAGPATGPFSGSSTTGKIDSGSGAGLDKSTIEADLVPLFGDTGASSTDFANGFADSAVDFAKTAKVETSVTGIAIGPATVDPLTGSGATIPPTVATGSSMTGTIS